MLSYRILIAIAGLAAVPSAMVKAQATPNAQQGKSVFVQCMACHSLEAGKNGLGPTLHGLMGRKAGTVTGFSYSPAMKKANITWNEDTLKNFLSNPQKAVPGNKMMTAGMSNQTQLDNLIAYLQQATKRTSHA
ncbi:MAG TPA: cytochrome c family protein [Acetobacteraceae bacterium]|nr:cytochrome c family protein [Acetobacteraceae bacterium]